VHKESLYYFTFTSHIPPSIMTVFSPEYQNPTAARENSNAALLRSATMYICARCHIYLRKAIPLSGIKALDKCSCLSFFSAAQTSVVYQLQRRVRTLREQLQRRDLHLDLLRRKLSLQEDSVRMKSLLQSERDEANIRFVVEWPPADCSNFGGKFETIPFARELVPELGFCRNYFATITHIARDLITFFQRVSNEFSGYSVFSRL